MKRIPTPELLDIDAGTPAQIAGSLADLDRINRWFGGIGTTERMVERVVEAYGVAGAPGRRTGETPGTSFSLSLLDVAAGSGYVPLAARERLSRKGIHLEVTLLDRAASHVGNGGGTLVGDALALPFRDSSFDLVSSVLFVHHLSPDELTQCVRESLRVCRKAVLINDLIRNPVHLALVYAGLPLFRSRLTHHDAPASVRQAYSKAEIHEIVRRAGAVRIEIDSYFLYRMGVIAWKQ